MTKHTLARNLVPFGIRPQTIRIGSGTAKGYLREQFAEAFASYLPSVENLQNIQSTP